MNHSHYKMSRAIFTYFLVLLISAPAMSYSESEQDLLRPCINDLMGMDVINNYNDLLRKHLFTEEDVADYANLVKLIVNPSFKKEWYLAVYKTRQGPYRLEYSEPSDSIWYSMQYDKTLKEHRKDLTKIEDIKIKTYRKTISENLSNSISRVWWEMIRTQQYPPGNEFNILDGTMFIFSSGLGNCGMCFGGEGKNVNSLIQIGQKLKKYSLQEETSQKTEAEIMELVNQLYDKITTQPVGSVDQSHSGPVEE